MTNIRRVGGVLPFFVLFPLLTSGAGPSQAPAVPTPGLPAFPGAEGFGRYATGGRGGEVYHVTNLNDAGKGSFRDAVSKGHRTVVFDVGGNIILRSDLSVTSDITIAGETAPGDGVAVQGQEVSFSGSHNVIVRYLRMRQGHSGNKHKCTVGMDDAHDIILDHVSIEFGQWDNIDMNKSTNITVQNSIIADPIGQQFNAHQESSNVTWYRNIFANAHNRSPLAKGNTQFVNNVVYGFQAGYTAGDSAGKFSHDVVNNYFISSPQTKNSKDAFFQMNNQSVYAAGNMEDTNKDGKLNGEPVGNPGGATHLKEPWSPTTASLPTLSAAEAYAAVVASAGASLHRDEVDKQVIADVTSLGKAGHLWTGAQQLEAFSNNGYGKLNGGTAPVDTDHDGIPDAWETAHGLNPKDPADANKLDKSGYTMLEVYLHELVAGTMLPTTAKAPFTLSVEPAVVTLRQGGRATIKIHVQRNGYDGAIALKLFDLPGHVTAPDATIPEGKDTVEMVLTGDAKAYVGSKVVSVRGAGGRQYLKSPGFQVNVLKR